MRILRSPLFPCVALLLLHASGSADPQPHAPRAGCPEDPHRVQLDCMNLTPTPDLQQAAGTIRLMPPPTPFGVAVAPDGRPRYELIAELSGLPPASTLGDYTTYVAWYTTVAFDSVVPLGAVGNGRTHLGEVRLEQFRVLITAERTDTASTRSRRLVLRGSSPGMQLLAHRDLIASNPAAPAVQAIESMRGSAEPAAQTHDHAAHAPPTSGVSWSMPPQPPWMMPMSAMHAHAPDVAPFRAGTTLTADSLPLARAREEVVLRDGDTMRLHAMPVRTRLRGTAHVMYGYNGQQPGPLLRVRRGTAVHIELTNGIELPTAVHWHGIRLDNRFDGAVGVTQPPVPPGGRFHYSLEFPDAGIFWYHPHSREDIQLDLGLAGNILVEGDAGDFAPVNREEVLLLDDILVGADGTLFPHGAEATTHALMGRFGNVLLVNGSTDYGITTERDAVIRFYLTNASNARFFNLSFDNGARMKLVGGDAGRFEREVWTDNVVIAPSERYIVDVHFPRSGRSHLLNRIQALDHMAGWQVAQVDTLGTVRVGTQRVARDVTAEHAALRRNDDVSAGFAALRAHTTRAPDRTITLDTRIRDLTADVAVMLWGVPVPIDWNDPMPMTNWLTTGRQVTWILRDDASGAENMDLRWRFRAGDLVKVRVANDRFSAHPMAHPIHFHGQRFVVLSRNGRTNDNLVWKDTAIVAVGETVDLLVEMAQPGRWMLHCHIAEHISAGMMATFDVEG